MLTNCLVLITHTFRLNSRIFREVLKNSDKITVIYISPWYNTIKEKSIINKGNLDFYKKSIGSFSFSLKEDLGIPFYVIKSDKPESIIDKICEENNIDNAYYDMPLFGKSSWLKTKTKLTVIDSDSYDPKCERMTAKSRWVYWSKNRGENIICNPEIKLCESLKLNLPVIKPKKELFNSLKTEVDLIEKRLADIIPLYHQTRNHKEGSTLLSKYLHHGVIDAAELTSGILSISPGFLNNDDPIVPLLRQLAFREICIRKARIKDLTMEMSANEWAKKLLDKKSYENLIEEKPTSFTKEEFLKGETNSPLLDKEIKRLIKEKWAPNRIRMWLSSQCYYGLGGGIESLETLIKLFNIYSDDGQSPNNYVCCVEAMRLQYGKVMNYNTKRTFKLIGEKIVTH